MSGEFASPIDIGLPATPAGVPDELYEEFNRVYNAIKTLQQKFGSYNGLEVLDPTRYITDVNPNPTESVQVQRLTPVLGTASVALSAGQFISLNFGAGLVFQKADASASASQIRAWGWVPNAIAAGAKGIAYFQMGINTGFGGLSPSLTYYLSTTTPGGITSTKPVAVGTLVQEVGVALSATELFVALSGSVKVN